MHNKILNVFNLGNVERYIILLFYTLAVVGAFIATKALKEDK